MSCRDPRGWTMRRGHPPASRLRQMVSYLKDLSMMGLASAWAMTRLRPKEYPGNVDAATRCSELTPTPDLACYDYMNLNTP